MTDKTSYGPEELKAYPRESLIHYTERVSLFESIQAIVETAKQQKEILSYITMDNKTLAVKLNGHDELQFQRRKQNQWRLQEFISEVLTFCYSEEIHRRIDFVDEQNVRRCCLNELQRQIEVSNIEVAKYEQAAIQVYDLPAQLHICEGLTIIQPKDYYVGQLKSAAFNKRKCRIILNSDANLYMDFPLEEFGSIPESKELQLVESCIEETCQHYRLDVVSSYNVRSIAFDVTRKIQDFIAARKESEKKQSTTSSSESSKKRKKKASAWVIKKNIDSNNNTIIKPLRDLANEEISRLVQKLVPAFLIDKEGTFKSLLQHARRNGFSCDSTQRILSGVFINCDDLFAQQERAHMLTEVAKSFGRSKEEVTTAA